MTIRVRFAPSPTGFLHVGGARTALFNYLYARREGGVFILRIEDTDRARSSDEMTRAILDSLEWLGLSVDDGPYHQADGLPRHREHVSRLLATGSAYRCFCSPEELEARRSAARQDGVAFRYDGRCRRMPVEDAEHHASGGEPFAVRFAVPEGVTAWSDLVHGVTTFENQNLDDFILQRSDGTPVYNMAVVSDDMEMAVTHVIRGDDHLSNTPKQILIYEALGADVPEFAHVPMILGTDGKRLSKRHGALSVGAYRDMGILPEAMVNFLALLGWSPGDDREVMTLDELTAAFSLDRILKKSAVFDPEKLTWLNGQHISHATAGRLLPRVEEWLTSAGVTAGAAHRDHMIRVIDLAKPRARTIEELGAQVAPFFTERAEYDEHAVQRFWKRPAEAADALKAYRERLSGLESWSPEDLEAELRSLAEERDIGAGKIIHPLRVALTGLAVSPGIFEVLELMGRPLALRRIQEAVGYLDARAATESTSEEAGP
jgi:glutamyl-tRNA synthetase